MICIAGAIILLRILIGLNLGTEFLPELDEGGFDIRCVLPAGISLKEANKVSADDPKEIAKFSEVKFVISQLGRNDDGTDPFGPNRIETSFSYIRIISGEQAGISTSFL